MAAPATPSASPSAPAASLRLVGEKAITDGDGYTFTVKYDAEFGPFTKSIANDKPGFSSASITEQTGTITLTNTTAGRITPVSLAANFIVTALYQRSSQICRTLATQNQFPTIGDQRDAEDYCALVLADVSPIHGASTQLSVGGSIELKLLPQSAGANAVSVAAIPESNWNVVTAELTKPARLVLLTQVDPSSPSSPYHSLCGVTLSKPDFTSGAIVVASDPAFDSCLVY